MPSALLLPLTQTRLAEILESGVIREPYPHLLRWLIWFPLLSVEELTRLEQARLAKQKQTRSQKRVAALLQELERAQLISHVNINEPGWPHQHRYFVTDAGLYVYAALAVPPLSVPRLAQAYAVERDDLIAALSRIDIHLALSAFFSKLVTEGSASSYPVVSFQQPWMQTDTIFGRRQTLRLDAAFLLASPHETIHAFFVRVDTNERYPFERKRERIPLVRLLNLRHGLHLQREAMPPLLILTGTSRLKEWATLLEKTSEQRGIALLDGGITTLEQLLRGRVYGSIWWTLTELVEGASHGAQIHLGEPSMHLLDLLGPAASQALAERFSQRRTFEHLLTERHPGLVRKTSRPLPSFVGKPFSNDIASLSATALSDALRGTKAEQREATVLLNLALSATQKDVLFWLTHQPLLTLHHLARLHDPQGKDVRSIQKQMSDLSTLNLLVPFQWYNARSWRERERYMLAEAALRYSALREGRQATYYLLLPEKQSKYKVVALSIQQGTAGLFGQMDHTHGLYDCIVRMVEEAHREQGQIITWKSASESVRSYLDPLTHVPMQVRPDAELVYQGKGQMFPHSILVEYDRATTKEREIRAKYQSYADYLDYTGLTLPPILVITQHERAAARIRACIDAVDLRLPIIVVLEGELERRGVLAMLTQLNHTS
jgi:hypothetical protein